MRHYDIEDAQKLIDICFECVLVATDTKYTLYKQSNEKKAEWVADQLRACGFDTMPMGMSWGVLKDRYRGVDINDN